MTKSVADQLREAVAKTLKQGRTLNEIATTAGIGQAVLWRFMKDPNKTLTVDTAAALAKSLGIKLTLG
jgi:uncharacterized protein YerC